jgi:hypothetical protein
VVVHGFSQDGAPYGGVSIVLKDTGAEVDLHPVAPGNNPIFIRADPPVVLTRDTWHCIQLEVGVSATQGSVLLRVDNRIAAMSTEPMVTLPSTGYRNASAGIVFSDPDQQPVQVFVDELIADDTAPIPCDLTRR